MRRALSIRTQVLGLCAALLLIAAVGQLLFGTFFARAYFLNQKKAEIEDFFWHIRDNYPGDDPEKLYELLREGEDVQNIRVAIYSDTGELIYTSRPMREGYGVDPFFPILNEDIPFSTVPEAQELPGRTWEDAQLGLTGEFAFQNETRYVLLWVMVASIEGSITAFNHVSVWIVGAVLLVGALASILFARKITRPIRKIQQVSRQMAGLDFSARADEASSVSELRDLACSINQMGGQLSAAIEELRRANSLLQEDVERQKRLEQMRREFVAAASHEMKTPLCLLQMYAENLKNNVSGIDKDYYCDTIIDEVGRLSDLVGGMLELSAIENGLAAMDMGPLDLGELCAGILARMAPVLGRFQMVRAITPGCMVCGDAKFLGMAVENFLTNAVAHTPEGGKIKVTVESAEGAICLTVSNQGPHIPPDRLERIWDSFYKVDEARVRTTGNHAGLGLAIVKNVVTRLGGTCRAGNTAEGMEFAFSLPAADNVE